VGYFENDTNMYLVIPYALNGDLHSAITRLGNVEGEGGDGGKYVVRKKGG
jgi:hypothetical protein